MSSCDGRDDLGGVALRSILAFDPGHLATASVVSTFSGAAIVPETEGGSIVKRAFRIPITSES